MTLKFICNQKIALPLIMSFIMTFNEMIVSVMLLFFKFLSDRILNFFYSGAELDLYRIFFILSKTIIYHIINILSRKKIHLEATPIG